ncbi:MAG TPA: phosphatidylinositol-specific phospholipase C domain-containing protein [Chryseolinea sp.]
MKSRFFGAITLTVFLLPVSLRGQNLTFGSPVNYLPHVRTDKAVDITRFKNGFFVVWKNMGDGAAVNLAYLGKQDATEFSEDVQTVSVSKTNAAPVLRVLGDRLYALWISDNGNLHYVMNNSDSTFDTGHVNTVAFSNAAKLRGGVSCAPFGNAILMVSHADDKNTMVHALLETTADGTLRAKDLTAIAISGSSDYPFVVALNNRTARITFKGANQDAQIYSADYTLDTKTWSNKTAIGFKTKTSPALYHVFNSTRLFYVWRGDKKNNRLYYASTTLDEAPQNRTVLPEEYTTDVPVSLCAVDDKKFVVSFVGKDNKLYLSYFTNYNPARWQEDILFPAKANYTLKDIVIPGSHDAGMSVLSGTGGINAGSINECNVLTQTQTIEHQLRAGLRMFDLRVGVFKSELYTKHCSSDCMADAMGGGYGEKFSDVLLALKRFLKENNKEFVLLTLSHFCPKETSTEDIARLIAKTLGNDLMFDNRRRGIQHVRLSELAGKAIITFEKYAYPTYGIDSSSMQPLHSKAFLNLRREYAATNNIAKLLAREVTFFNGLKDGARENELIRLDWQLTQSSDEAAMVCNDFQNDKMSPVLNGAILLTNVIRKHRSIIDMSLRGNKYLVSSLNGWIADGIITKKNKPNVLYVDAAGAWITDFCIALNETDLYRVE